jgi:hypothetical protein
MKIDVDLLKKLAKGRLSILVVIGICLSVPDDDKVVLAVTILTFVGAGVVAREILLKRAEDRYANVHLGAAGIHIGSALVLCALLVGQNRRWNSRVTRTVSSWKGINNGSEPDCGNNPCYVDSDIRKFDYELQLVDVIVFAALVSGYYHVRIAIDTSKAMKFRWHDYSVSASLITVVVAALSGISDIFMLIIVGTIQFFLLDATYDLEQRVRSSEDRSTVVLDFLKYTLIYVIGWLPILYSFGSAWEEEPRPPDVIVTIIIVIFILYASFIFVFIYGFFVETTDIAYIVLSLITKTSLHWMLYNGIVGRQDRVFNTFEEAVLRTTTPEPDVVGLSLSVTVPVVIGVGLGVFVSRVYLKQNNAKTNFDEPESKALMNAFM